MTQLSTRQLVVIYLGALVVRLAYVLGQYQFGGVDASFVTGDSALYLRLAGGILTGHGMASDGRATAFVSPGFPLFLAACQAAFGPNPLWTSLFQCLLSAAACVFIAHSSALMFSVRVGLAAGAIAALYYELVLWTSGQLLTEPLYHFLLSAALLALVSATLKANLPSWAMAGALFGLAALVRPTALPVAIGLGLIVGVAALLRRSNQWRSAAVFLCVCVLVMTPWGVRNYLALGTFTLVSTEGGHVLWLGNNPDYDRFEHPDFKKFGGYTAMIRPPLELTAALRGRPEAEANRIYARAAWRHIADHPGRFLIRAAHKTWNMWRPTFSGSSSRNWLLSWTCYPAVLLAAVAGLVLAWRRATGDLLVDITRPAGLLCCVVLMHLAIHMVITGEIRFRVPLWAALIPFAALTATRGFDCVWPARPNASATISAPPQESDVNR